MHWFSQQTIFISTFFFFTCITRLSKITKKSSKLQCSLNLLDNLELEEGSWCWWRLVLTFPFLTFITTLLNTTVKSLLQVKEIKLNLLTFLQQPLNQLAILGPVHTKTIVNANASKRKLFYVFRPSVHTKMMKTLTVNA